MTKLLMIAAAVVTLASGFAIPALGQSAGESRSDRPTVNQIMAQDEARLARLKADLQLTSEQEGDWGTLDKALRDIAKRRAERLVAAWDKQGDSRTPPMPIERMRRAADSMREQADDLKSTADAAEPLYGKLNDQQKRILIAYLDRSFDRRR
jgi:DNA-directed RNA polymerase specialized sigma subunit